ncbi:hypothetical protein PSHT_06202 [Puccinia striiformis]|uniref:Uncharacterized protein n=1 Tax=Puccinia striiformis TaxID=27350 RepID=A0A2S4W8V6_9BASI|nr:hypothetical protein PSHT_06202 [Puccinia striiformis]
MGNRSKTSTKPWITKDEVRRTRTRRWRKKQRRDPTVRVSDLTDMFKAKEVDKNDNLIGSQDQSSSSSSSSSEEFQSTGQRPLSTNFIHPSRLKDSAFNHENQSANQAKPGVRKGPFFSIRPTMIRILNCSTSLAGWYPASSSDTWRTFIRSESTSEIESAHDAKKAGLTEHMRRKHKDAIKRDRKWGNNNKQPHKHRLLLD